MTLRLGGLKTPLLGFQETEKVNFTGVRKVAQKMYVDRMTARGIVAVG
jgi:hypothetical protein